MKGYDPLPTYERVGALVLDDLDKGIGEVCERCLADKIRGTYEDKRAGTPLAPLLGTAFHLLAQQRLSNSPEGRAGLVLVEKRVDVAQIDGYGPIRGTVDLFDTECREVIDWKVLSKARIYCRL